MGEALRWLAVARECFRDPYGSLQRGFLTSTFALVVGLERVWHLDQMDDLGFALLTGGRRCPSRHLVGGWRCHLPWYAVDAFCRRTSPWELRLRPADRVLDSCGLIPPKGGHHHGPRQSAGRAEGTAVATLDR
jgi:hypothetical protein